MIEPEILELKRQMSSLHRNFYSLASELRSRSLSASRNEAIKMKNDEKGNKEKDKKEDKKRRE